VTAQFKPYDIVRMINAPPGTFGAIRDMKRSPPSWVWFYFVRTPDGRVLEVSKEEMEPTGESEAPFHYYEPVRLHPRDEQRASLIGKIGTIAGISYREETGEWGFSVQIGDEQAPFLMQDELEKIADSQQGMRDEERQRHRHR
jgi:hypothetical protein